MFFNWFPGHMEKARQEIASNIKKVDFVVEIVDSRIPYSSANPLLEMLIPNKKRIIVFSKKDLCDDKKTDLWIKYFNKKGYTTFYLDLLKIKKWDFFWKELELLSVEKRNREIKKQIKPQAIKVMVVGVPNVGKSTFINQLIKRKITKTANVPGVTRNGLWVKINPKVYLFDTPGILWPNIKNKQVGLNLVMANCIKQGVVQKEEVLINSVKYLLTNYYSQINKIFPNIDISNDKSIIDVLINYYNLPITQYNDLLAIKFFKELASGKFGKFTFEIPDDF